MSDLFGNPHCWFSHAKALLLSHHFLSFMTNAIIVLIINMTLPIHKGMRFLPVARKFQEILQKTMLQNNEPQS